MSEADSGAGRWSTIQTATAKTRAATKATPPNNDGGPRTSSFVLKVTLGLIAGEGPAVIAGPGVQVLFWHLHQVSAPLA